MTAFDDYFFTWPPRPETKIAVPMLDFYESRNWWAQKKKNGACQVIACKGNQVIFKTRHNEDNRLWAPQGDHNAFFAGSKKWNVYTAELLHSKTKHLKDELYIFDQLVKDGVYLVGSTFAERQQMLHDQFHGSDEGDQIRLAPRITLAKSFNVGFTEMYKHLKKEDEGLVLKNPNGALQPCYKIDSNASWQVKCRIAHKNYSF